MFETAMLFGGRVSMLTEASGKEFPPTRRWSEGTGLPLENGFSRLTFHLLDAMISKFLSNWR
jgi:hypothetical protein